MIVVAHRGASAYAPENTLAALREAGHRGADMAELDVRETADGEFVLMHDPTLRRTTNARQVYPDRRPWRVADFTLAEIRRLDAGTWFGGRFVGEGVPTLDEALRTLRGVGLGAVVEFKAQRRDALTARRLAARIAGERHWASGGENLILQSFDRIAVREIARNLPGVRVAVLGRIFADFTLRRVARYAHQITPHHRYVTASYVRYAHERGLTVFSWTVNADTAIRRVIRDGVDGIISDYPDRVARYLRTFHPEAA